ncbi:3-isopropylmalate dehydratase small subunit [Roseomonas indoligenes]|uniref:3-isopropylmalate dehydratase small subunit n=1 Tax=Roseomonas indoligenes TaxID=2820811 RepID=A0A940S653_9PROT|nr:3-isopropylmalate dehydratase small subunit [Pararoseomonas indoligenes]MBP0495146.1 3-isopropylmalate dehydratase small subunit [Pararoseomonas indoligenes]
MTPFTTVTGAAAPLMRPNTDTDVIIPIQRLTGTARDTLGRYAFEPLRYGADGAENPDFILNRPAFRSAPILIAGPNFGCGSSREGAVWALMGMGLRCVIAESFGDIFQGNCFQNGMLPVALPADAVERLARQAASGAPVTVDLASGTVTPPEGPPMPFTVAPLRREALLEGLDELGQTRKRSAEIAAWQERDRAARPWIWRETA